MNTKSLHSILILIVTFYSSCVAGHNNYEFTLSPDERFQVESIPQIMLKNVRVQVIHDDPWDSLRDPTPSSGRSGFEEFKETWSNIGHGIWGGCKSAGKGVGYVGKKFLTATETVFDRIDDGLDAIFNWFEDETPISQNNAQTKAATAPAKNPAVLESTNSITNNTQHSSPITTNAQPTQTQHHSLDASARTPMSSPATEIEITVLDEHISFQKYRDELTTYVAQIEQRPFQRVHDRCSQRLEAFNKIQDIQNCSLKTYTVSQEITPFMRKHSLDIEAYEVCHGNIIQHQLHQEIIEILTSSCEIDHIFSEYQKQALFTDLVVEGADLARQLNAQGDVVNGFKIADYCGWLNEAEYPLLASIIKQAGGIIVGTVEGGCNIVKNTCHMLCHPYDTAKGLVIITGQLGKFLLEATGELGIYAHHISFDGALDDTAYFPLYNKDLEDAFGNYELQNPYFIRDVEAIQAYYDELSENFAKLPPEEQTRKITAFCFELYFTGKFIGQLGKVKSAATAHVIKPGITALTNKLELYRYKAISQTYTRIANTCKTVKNFVRRKPSDSPKYEWVMDQAGNWREVITIEAGPSIEIPPSTCTSLVPVYEISSVPVSTTKNITDVQRSIANNILVERVEAIEFVNNTMLQEVPTLVPGAAQQALNAITHIPEHIDPAELDRLCAFVNELKKEWGEIKNKFLKIKVKHIFTIELKKNGQINGFHHDLLGYLEEMDIIKLENIKMGKFGEYMADVVLNGKVTREKTFFPKHWTRQQVLENIIESFDNFINSKMRPNLQPDGKYHIISHTNSGMKIEMFIDKKCKLLSAYPII